MTVMKMIVMKMSRRTSHIKGQEVTPRSLVFPPRSRSSRVKRIRALLGEEDSCLISLSELEDQRGLAPSHLPCHAVTSLKMSISHSC